MSSSNANMLQGIDARTQLVGHNRLELLLFRLSGKQRYGINVFKVREVVSCPELTKIPNAHPTVRGITNMRGNTFMVIDLQHAIGMTPIENLDGCSVIVAEYNRKMQGFLVPHIEHIVNKHWEDVLAPPRIAGKNHYLTAVTQIDDEIIEILDVEKVLYEITGALTEESLANEAQAEVAISDVANRCHVLVADDSSVARNQIKRTLSRMGIKCTTCNDGKAALDTLIQWAETDAEEYQRLLMIISDVEMPVMDGYTLTNELRKMPAYEHSTILLHTSLSGVFDSSLLNKVKADAFLSKFDSEELTSIITESLEKFVSKLEEKGL